MTVGLLTTGTGFPLQVHLFEGNKAETKTLIPVLTGFAERHQIDDVVVVADAGMLSAANLVALEDAGFGFIVASKATTCRRRPRRPLPPARERLHRRADRRGHPHHGHRQRLPEPAGGL